MTTMDDMELLVDELKVIDQIEAETEANPEWFGVLVSMGADDQGVDMNLVRRAWELADEALALASDETQSTERREACRQIGGPLAESILELAIAGKRVMNECQAMAAAERPRVH